MLQTVLDPAPASQMVGTKQQTASFPLGNDARCGGHLEGHTPAAVPGIPGKKPLQISSEFVGTDKIIRILFFKLLFQCGASQGILVNLEDFGT